MASIINAGTTTSTALNVTTDTSGALDIQTSGVNAISINSSQAVTLTNPLPVGSGGTGLSSLGTGVATALGQNVTGSGSIVLGTSPSLASPTLTGTPIAPTAALGTNTTQIATTAFTIANGIPSGCVVMWSGSIATIPSGWFICDGTNSTPDLRNRFVVGAGSTYAVAATGGSTDAIVVSHTHTATVTDPGHSHVYQGYINVNQGGTGGGSAQAPTNKSTDSVVTGITVANSTEGSSGTNANLPPYYALAYIMKG